MEVKHTEIALLNCTCRNNWYNSGFTVGMFVFCSFSYGTLTLSFKETEGYPQLVTGGVAVPLLSRLLILKSIWALHFSSCFKVIMRIWRDHFPPFCFERIYESLSEDLQSSADLNSPNRNLIFLQPGQSQKQSSAFFQFKILSLFPQKSNLVISIPWSFKKPFLRWIYSPLNRFSPRYQSF